MKNKKTALFFVLFIFVIMFLLFLYTNTKNNSFSIRSPIGAYNLQNKSIKNNYLNFIKNNITPELLRDYIDNKCITFEFYNADSTGELVMSQMKFEGYTEVFNKLFDKNISSFDKYPVSDNFKKKFPSNLTTYFNLAHNSDSDIHCGIFMDEQKLTVNEFYNFYLNEPAHHNTHHFTYTLDSDGNIDDVVYDYTEENLYE